MRRRTSGRAGWPPPELLSFDPADWPDDGPNSSVSEGRLPGWLVRQMRQWSAWCAARELWEAEHGLGPLAARPRQWCEEHGGFWPTGEVEMWAEAWAVRPGPTARPILPRRNEAGR